MNGLEGIVGQVAEALLGMGWRGVLSAVLVLFAWFVVRKGIEALPAPTPPPPPQSMPDVAGDPDRDPAQWNVDPEAGAVVTQHDDPDDRPPG